MEELNTKEYYLFNADGDVTDILSFSSDKEKKEYIKKYPNNKLQASEDFELFGEEYYGLDD